MNYVEMVEAAWALSDAAYDYARNAGRDVDPREMWERVFAPSPLVDHERTLRESGPQPTRIFLHSPYGVQFNAEQKDWLPFRHGPLDLSKLPPVDIDGA
ncbi:MAG TPA: hypothetical protein VEB20_03850 [Azospirillaceae bacterium]|nr:hypothetical protein [Azospirillaceae bacterium]